MEKSNNDIWEVDLFYESGDSLFYNSRELAIAAIVQAGGRLGDKINDTSMSILNSYNDNAIGWLCLIKQ